MLGRGGPLPVASLDLPALPVPRPSVELARLWSPESETARSPLAGPAQLASPPPRATPPVPRAATPPAPRAATPPAISGAPRSPVPLAAAVPVRSAPQLSPLPVATPRHSPSAPLEHPRPHRVARRLIADAAPETGDSAADGEQAGDGHGAGADGLAAPVSREPSPWAPPLHPPLATVPKEDTSSSEDDGYVQVCLNISRSRA